MMPAVREGSRRPAAGAQPQELTKTLQAMAATGTDDKPTEVVRGQYNRKSVQNMANAPTIAKRPKTTKTAVRAAVRAAALTSWRYGTLRESNRKLRILTKADGKGFEPLVDFRPQRFSSTATYPEKHRENEGSSPTGQQIGSAPAEISPDLQAIFDAWPALPEAIKAGILAMVKAAGIAST